MAYNMKSSIYFAVAFLVCMVTVSCTKPYELDIDFALNRTDLRFKNPESQSYFMVYSRSSWKVAFEQEISWARLSKTEGSGNMQVNVYCNENTGVSRGVNIIVTNNDGRVKAIYLSQNSGTADPQYKPEDETIDLFSSSVSPVVAIKTNLDEASIAAAAISVSCPGYETPWIDNVVATKENVSFDVDAFLETGSRSGAILITFSCAKWDENPCRCVITVNQTDGNPKISLSQEYALDPAGDVYTDVDVQTNWNPKYYTFTIGHDFADSSWIVDHKYDGKKLISIKAEKNEGPSARSTLLNCYVKDANGNVIQGTSVSATLSQKVAPKPLIPIDLTQGGKYANSFLIESTDTALYCVELKKVDGTAIENVQTARVLWQTTYNLVASAYAKDGKLYFTQSPGLIGNALIGVYDAKGKIVWSFHIWITNISVMTNKFGDYVFMDRNLGAITSKAPTGNESDNAGLHYEWGRKDPFPPVDGYSPTGNRNHMDISPSNAISFEVAQDGKSLSYSIENPCTYLWGSAGSGKEDWIDVQDKNLWGETGKTKTNYDPCPYGWEVPSESQVGDILTKCQAAGSLANYCLSFNDDDDNLAVFPCPGYYRRTTNSSSQLCNVGTFGWLWTRTTGVYNNAYIAGRRLQIHNTVSNRTMATQPNRWGANVRCVKQK